MKRAFCISVLILLTAIIFAQTTGGPDTFGYTFIDSTEPNGPAFNWYTSSMTNEITGFTDDNYVGPFAIGFNFSFYDSVYDQCYIGSNGMVGFDEQGMNDLGNDPVPSDGTPNSQIFWCWDDLNPTYGWSNSHVYADNAMIDQMNAYIISFVSYSEYGGSTAPNDCITAQIILFENGNIRLQYQTIGTSFDINSCTVGIENETGTDGLEYLFDNNGAMLQENLAIDFLRPIPQTDDLRALSIEGDIVPTAGNSIQYDVAVMNRGTNPADNYNVKLMQYVDGLNDVELASQSGNLLQPNATEVYVFNHTFTTSGDVQLYGYVDYTVELAPDDNMSPLLDVSVQPTGTAVCTIGDGDNLSFLTPFNFFYTSSLTQTLIYPDEIGIGGVISGIDFHVNWAEDLPGQAMNMWIGETGNADLSGGFIPAGNLTQAFSTTYDFTSGEYFIHIDFDTPYAYNGGNLVLMYQRPLGTQMNSSANTWYCSGSTYPNRSLELHDTAVDFDPYTDQTGTYIDNVPNIRLYFVTSGLGALEGTVTDGVSAMPNVEIIVQGTNYSTITNANGLYTFPYLPAGDYTITANTHGYYESNINVTVIEDQMVNGDIVMNQLPTCSVSGQIIGSDTMSGIEGSCHLTGYEDYDVQTDANGFFTINGVYTDNTYDLTLSSQGYSSTSQDVVVGTSNIDLGPITLQEIAFPVGNVTAELLDTDEALINWNPPVTGGTGGAWIHKDDGVNADGVGLTNGGTFDVACKYDTNELAIYSGFFINSLRFYLQSPATSLTVKVYSGINGDNLLLEQPLTNYIDGDWNEVQLDTSIMITGQTPIWFGYQVEHSSVDRPAGCDAGPHQPGGDMIKTNTVWEELHVIASTLDTNWNLQAFISQVPTNRGTVLGRRVMPASVKAPIVLSRESNHRPIEIRTVNERSLLDYTIFRLNEGDEDNPNLWSELATVVDTTYTDSDWIGVLPGVYRFAVIANYTNNVHSLPVFSNWLSMGLYGSLTANLTTNVGDIPAGASVDLTALTPNPDGEYLTYHSEANDQGIAIIPHVWYGDYRITTTLDGYQGNTIDSFTIDGNNSVDIMITEIVIPAHDVVAEVNDHNTLVNVHWGEPGAGSAPQWLAWDSGENGNGVGTGAAAQFDIACRWEPEHLDDFGGMFITEVKFFPREQNCEYSVRVWSGPNAQTILADQLCDDIVNYNDWHTAVLDNPVQIDPSQELWVGVSLDTQTGHPAGCDSGPAIDGYGNMMLWSGSWQTLLEVAPTLDHNWNIQAWVDWETRGREAVQLGRPFVPEETPTLDSRLLATGFENRDTREALGYNLYRLVAGNEGDPLSWTLVEALTPDTLFVDLNWPGLPSDDYRYAVKVAYTGGVESPASISNVIHKDQRGYLEGFITNANTFEPIAEAVITADTLQIVTDEMGHYILCLDEGLHNIHLEANMYLPLDIMDVPVLGEAITIYNIELTPRAIVIGDDFESYDDFCLEFGDWTLVDNDNDNTSTFASINYENAGAQMAFMVFNPEATVPPTPFAEAHSGSKYIASFAGIHDDNDDWIITPTIQLGENGGLVSFWARSYTNQFGLEEFNIGVSTESSGTDNFTMLNGDTPVEVGLDWTYYTYDLSAYTDDVIRVGLQCCSSECFALFVDDLSIDSVGGIVDNPDNVQPVTATRLLANYPNPFNPTTTISFSLKENSKVALHIYNILGQKVTTVVDEYRDAGNHSVTWNGTDSNNRKVSSGVYFYRMETDNYVKSKKMLLMK